MTVGTFKKAIERLVKKGDEASLEAIKKNIANDPERKKVFDELVKAKK